MLLKNYQNPNAVIQVSNSPKELGYTLLNSGTSSNLGFKAHAIKTYAFYVCIAVENRLKTRQQFELPLQ